MQLPSTHSTLTFKQRKRLETYALANKGLKQKRQTSVNFGKTALSAFASLAAINLFPTAVNAQNFCAGIVPNMIATGIIYGAPSFQFDFDNDGMYDLKFISSNTVRRMSFPANPVYTNVLEGPGNVPLSSGQFPRTATNAFNSGLILGTERDVFIVFPLTAGGYGFVTLRGNTQATKMIDAWGSGAANVSDVVFSSSYQTCPIRPCP